jgi:hypothetical protein
VKLLRHFDNLLATTVNLNQSRIDLLDERVQAITSYFQADDVIGPAFLDLLRQGSYAHRTIIKPQPGKDFDADILLQLSEDADWEPCDYIAEVYKALRRSERYRDLVDRKTHCVTIDYKNDFHVDVVPYIVRADSGYVVNRKTNEFELTSPEGFNAWLDEKNRIANSNLVRVIRLIKYLRDTKRMTIKSVILTTLLAEQVDEAAVWSDPGHYSDAPTALVNVVESLDSYLQLRPEMPLLADPSCPGQSFNHRWDQAGYESFRSRFHDYAGQIAQAYETSEREESIELWQSLFGTGFCAPTTTKDRTLTAAIPQRRDTEEFLDRDRNIPFETTRYQLRMVGRVYGRRGFREYDLPRYGNTVAKNCRVRFRVASCNVPRPYKVYWKIRNHGEEAARAHQLRGEIQEGGMDCEHRESTAYPGEHYVECYIVTHGRCVARDHQPVIVL